MIFAAAISTPVPSRPATQCRRGGRAFTLIELLVVMGIIILLMALALPAFRFITGSRSAEAASNQIAAALSVARAQAIGVQQIRGIAIYRDSDNDRSVAALVELRSGPLADFVSGTTATGGGVNYARGQYVQDTNKAYVCIETYISTGATTDPGTAGGATYWRPMPSMDAQRNLTNSFVELIPGSEFVTLPTGIDARGVANQFAWPLIASPDLYRYLNPVVILFDANGQVISTQFYIAREGLLGHPIEIATSAGQSGGWVPGPLAVGVNPSVYGLPTTARTTPTTTSQIGLVLFDTEVYKNISQSATINQVNEWLDQNATPLMINRYNGTLVKGD